MNKGIKVIRYRQNDTDERNLLVSSKSSLNLLEVLVRRRLNDLNLGVSEQEIGELTTCFINEANGLAPKDPGSKPVRNNRRKRPHG